MRLVALRMRLDSPGPRPHSNGPSANTSSTDGSSSLRKAIIWVSRIAPELPTPCRQRIRMMFVDENEIFAMMRFLSSDNNFVDGSYSRRAGNQYQGGVIHTGHTWLSKNTNMHLGACSLHACSLPSNGTTPSEIVRCRSSEVSLKRERGLHFPTKVVSHAHGI
jgi:hypothetical protein